MYQSVQFLSFLSKSMKGLPVKGSFSTHLVCLRASKVGLLSLHKA